ncbi:hypothetical protein Rhein_0156 [Rheinheimera sp. A13L]|uniref:hypothetical protein n=1 Tax=Rheinheimera sp. A13L TaxID=506534 RepID=UPI00021249BC|nr:hypothetical protein [Rheinheimera sp. A13L]EGM79696.1 hypothetical protein Rhein_0156 [Rheinheimera sp. A13L]
MRFILNVLIFFFIILIVKYFGAYIYQDVVQYTWLGVSMQIVFSLAFAGFMEYRLRRLDKLKQ